MTKEQLDEILDKRAEKYLYELMEEYGIGPVVQALQLDAERWDERRRSALKALEYAQ